MASIDKKSSSEKFSSKPKRAWDYKNEEIRELRKQGKLKDFKVTAESLELFAQGKGADYDVAQKKYSQGQGYIILVNLKTQEIHLIPSWNKDDGKKRVNKHGKPFTTKKIRRDNHGKEHITEEEWGVVSRAPLGGNSGDAHVSAAGRLGLGEFAGASGMLVGLGLWKGSEYLISELRGRSYSQNPFAISWDEEFIPTEGNYRSNRMRSLPFELMKDICKALLEQLPSDEHTIHRELIHFDNMHFICPLHTAAAIGNIARLKELLEGGGIDINELGGTSEGDSSGGTSEGDSSAALISQYTAGTPLHFAIKNRQWESVRFLLEHGADPDITSTLTSHFYAYSNEQITPISYAIMSGAPNDIIILLLDKGADLQNPNAIFQRQMVKPSSLYYLDSFVLSERRALEYHPLYFAITRKRYDLIGLLKKRGATLSDFPNIFSHLIKGANDRVIQYLIEQEKVLELGKINFKEVVEKYDTDMDWRQIYANDMEYTAKIYLHAWKELGLLTEKHIQDRLNKISTSGRICPNIERLFKDTLKELEEERRTSEKKLGEDRREQIALDAQPKPVTSLLTSFDHINRKSQRIEAISDTEKTLLTAISQGKEQDVKDALAAIPKPNINVVEPSSNCTPLQLAITAGHKNIVELLIDLEGKNINFGSRTIDNKSTIQLALESNMPMPLVLKMSQLPINRAFIYAVKAGDLAGVKKALTEGADINTIQFHTEYNALQIALLDQHHKIIAELLSWGINVNYSSKAMPEPLQLAKNIGAPADIVNAIQAQKMSPIPPSSGSKKPKP